MVSEATVSEATASEATELYELTNLDPQEQTLSETFTQALKDELQDPNTAAETPGH